MRTELQIRTRAERVARFGSRLDLAPKDRATPGQVVSDPTIAAGHRFARCVNCRRRLRLWDGLDQRENIGHTPALLWVHVDHDTHVCGPR